MTYVAGWDGGGTKTAVAYLDEAGNLLGRGIFGPLNPNGNTPEQVLQTVKHILDDSRHMPGGIEGCLCLQAAFAGFSNPDAQDMLTSMIREEGYQGELRLCGDHEAMLYGAVGGEGAVLISGTGSVCLGRNRKGETFRSGGWGHIIGDEGSGYAIGREILIAVAKAQDGRLRKTSLTGLVHAELDISGMGGLIRFVYDPLTDKAKIASLAPLLLAALEQGDEEASSIAQRASEDLYCLAVPVIEQLSLQNGTIAFSGGVITEYRIIRQGVETALQKRYPGLAIISPRQDAAVGAAMMALNRWKETERDSHA